MCTYRYIAVHIIILHIPFYLQEHLFYATYRTIDSRVRCYKTNSGLSVGYEHLICETLGTTMVGLGRRTQRTWHIFQI